MKKAILLTIFCFLYASMVISQDWVSFTRSTPQPPIINLTQSTNQQVSFTVEVCGMIKNDTLGGGDTYQRIRVPGAGQLSEIGEPELPFIRQLIAIPECDSVSLTVNITGQTAFSNYNIYPAPDFVEVQNPDSTVFMQEVFAFDSMVYSQNNYIIGQNAEIISIGYLRDQKYAEVFIYPIQFNPATNHINVMTNYSLSLDFHNPTSAVNVNTGIFNNVVSNNLLNYSSSGIRASVNDNVQGNGNVQWVTLTNPEDADNIVADYLIIVADAFFEPSNPDSEVLRIANHRAIYNGFDVVILNANNLISDALGFFYEGEQAGVEIFKKEQRIRTCIRRIYDGENAQHMYDGKLGYVLLVGDVDGANLGMPTSYEREGSASKPSDYYYSCVTREESIYDLLGDIYIGRFCVDNNLQNGLTELHNIVEKTIYFESEYSFEEWRNNVAHANGNSYVAEYFIAKVGILDYYDFIEDLLFEEDLTIVNYYLLEGQIYQPIIDMLNEGTPVMLYEGHGNYNTWQDGLTIDELQSNLTNIGKFPYVTSRACLTGYFDKMEGDCMAEALTTYSDEKGFVGFLGASRWHFQGNSTHEIEISPNYLQERIPYSIWNDLSFVTGEFILESKIGINATATAFLFNYFGDPALNIMAQGFEITHDVTLSDITTISTEVTVTNNAILTVPVNGQLFFENEGALIIDAGATLVLEDNVSIIARGGDNSLIVNGDIQVGNNVTFKSESENQLELLTGNQSLNLTIDYPQIENTHINSSSASLNIYHANVNTSLIEQNGGDLTIAFSVLGSSSVKAVNNTDIEYHCHIFQNTYTDGLANNEAVISINGYKNYAINNNAIFNNIETATQSYGIFINNSGSDRGHYHSIDENTIYSEITNESSVGIGVYSSYAEIENNYIYDNYCGIGIFNNSIVEIMGNQDETNTQRIMNNSMYQVYLSSTVFPTSFHWNMIYGSTLSDYFIYREINVPGIYPKADVRFNYWGDVSNVGNHLYPADHYGFEPIWDLGGGTQVSQTSEGLLYETAIQQVGDSAYIPAKNTFKQVVINYPETDFALSSMREILYLEPLANNDFVALQNWFLTEPTILQNEVLKKLGEELANKCDERLENYPDAIAWYESVIENPETMEDSIFAIIDLEHLYLQMGIDTSLRSFSGYVGKFAQYKPSSYVEHQVHKDELLSLLSGKAKSSDKEDLNSENESALGELMQNAPNPFSGSTTIEYNLRESSEVEIKVFDQTGKIVLETKFFKSSGLHKYIPETTNLPNGIYFYSLSVNGIQTDVKKMVLLK